MCMECKVSLAKEEGRLIRPTLMRNLFMLFLSTLLLIAPVLVCASPSLSPDGKTCTPCHQETPVDEAAPTESSKQLPEQPKQENDKSQGMLYETATS